MGERFEALWNIVKMPFMLILYIIYMFISLFIPSRYLHKLVNIKPIEKDINLFFENSIFLKMIALIIAMIVFIIS